MHPIPTKNQATPSTFLPPLFFHGCADEDEKSDQQAILGWMPCDNSRPTKQQ